MSRADETYADLLRHVLETGDERSDRTGTGTIGVFGHQMRFNLAEEFPLLTTKRIHWKSVVEELLWMISGSTNVKPLQDRGVSIWDEWADKSGDLGPVYGKQWRDWSGVASNGRSVKLDQLKQVIRDINQNPFSRRHIVSAWNPLDVPDMKLPPCHLLYQFHVTSNGRLNCQLYQRSADIFLGVPFNIASYALLTHLICEQTLLKPGEFVWTGGDTHLYLNHIDQAHEQLSRDGREAPTIRIRPDVETIDGYAFEDIELRNYNPHPPIKAEVAV